MTSPLGPGVRRFLASEAAGATVLLLGAAAALVWANSPWRASYGAVWGTSLSVGHGRLAIVSDLRGWVNEGLMTVFFLVIGLEIKRELVEGELRDRRTAALPAIAAVGGMVVPAGLFALVAAGGEGARGWGIPMATDIAFAVGVVALIGSRVPASLTLFLLTLAVVDDIGAVIVIAVFYARHLEPAFLAAVVALVAVMMGLRRVGVTRLAPFVALGVGVWLATRASGVHATIAGVVLGLLAPVSTAVRLRDMLHRWSSFAVAPLFAVANVGVAFRAGAFTTPGAASVGLGIGVGLVVGKVVGITGAAWLAVRCGLGRLPAGASWGMVAGVGIIAGVGFTVSLFMVELAFEAGALREAATIGVLASSTVAATLGTAILVVATRK